MLTVFWDVQGILLIEFMTRETTINSEVYSRTLKKLKRAIQKKRRDLLSSGVVFLHDNARPLQCSKRLQHVLTWEQARTRYSRAGSLSWHYLPRWRPINSCQVIYSQFGLAIHQNDQQARRRFVEWAQNEIAVVPDFHKRILFSDEVHFWLNGYVNKQNCRIWSEANPQEYVKTPLYPEKLTVWCALWAGGILLQKR
ncbi:uncharacterized protein TNCV_3552971 [Trichonephila clavipes]|nr:uncharacterized protein TNCV_3552971 [Trichonephila clavipes]